MKQLSIFSKAEDSMAKAIEAIRSLDLERAEQEIENALRIDPSTINPGVLHNLISRLKQWNPNRPLSDFLAGLWLSGDEVEHDGSSGSAEAELLDREIAEIALRGLGRRMESTSAFIRALLVDPFRVDLRRTKLREARLLFDKLCVRYPPDEARAMLLFQGWIEGLWEIKRPDKSVKDLEKDIRKRIAKTDDSERFGKLRRFSLYFYLDRIKSSGDIDIEARERMLELEPELFRLYLLKLGEMQKDIFC